jgi:hypothetical protein
MPRGVFVQGRPNVPRRRTGDADYPVRGSVTNLCAHVYVEESASREGKSVGRERRAKYLPSAWVWDGTANPYPLLLNESWLEDSRPYPTSAGDPHQRAPKQDTARTERKILEGGLTANCIQLARLQNRSIANQEKALRYKPPRCSRRKSHHRRGTKIRDQVFRMPAECCSHHGVGRQPGKSAESNDAANEGCFPKHGDRRLYRQSMQCRVHIVCRSRHCRCMDFQ